VMKGTLSKAHSADSSTTFCAMNRAFYLKMPHEDP
jgi:hypothetical protein